VSVSPRNGSVWVAVEGEAVARVAVRTRVVVGDPEVDGLVLLDGGIEQALPDARAVERVEQVDEVELASAGVAVARGPDPTKPTISPSTSAANILNSGPCAAQCVQSSARRLGETFSRPPC
jgi:hypothetical protein